ncbi:MAG: phenylalanine--tRNA ligase subunit alpha [Verrucomicrobia bacterium]|nr:phenylalanine--tRNA ligase subunit alpha [Verrucomicrobiota bacterium]
MLKLAKALLEETEKFQSHDLKEIEQFRLKILGNKGELKKLFVAFKDVDVSEKKEFGAILNQLKKEALSKVNALKEAAQKQSHQENEHIDLTRPVNQDRLGSRHPISIIRNEIIEVFSRLGYQVSEGPDIEDDWHNFTALNFPPEHPARDMQDTFFVGKNPDIALRTHTSSVQVRVMENNDPPIRTISPGRVYRNEAISARAHCFFHQIEGLYIDKGVSFADMKQTLLFFAKTVFGEHTKIRLRPSYFPFTEPSAEMDVSCSICSGDGCNVCKYTGYLEIMGCGMVDPNVLENCGIDSKTYSGFAFGMGIERIAQLKYNVNDLRLYSENDINFLDQFRAEF